MKKMTAILGLVLMYSAAFAGDATVVNQSKEVPSQKMYCNSSSYDGDALVCEVPKFKIHEGFVNIANDGLSALGFWFSINNRGSQGIC